MRQAISKIPPAPRRVRWIPILTLRWRLLLGAVLLFVYGGLVTLMFTFASLSDTGRILGPARDLRAVAPWVTIVPGSAFVVLWLRSVRDQRRLLRTGDISIGEATEWTESRSIGPRTLTVQFWFRDHHAEIHQGRDQIRLYSELGDSLTQGKREVLVVHDRKKPSQHRLIDLDHLLKATFESQYGMSPVPENSPHAQSPDRDPRPHERD
ncbi:MAG: hypothetical protein AAF196_06715 [Planctomycetota bacterium]